jgi:protein TonB
MSSRRGLQDEADLFAHEAPPRGLDVASGPRIGPPERLSATMALSTILFGVVILGVGFTLDDPAPVMPTLDVILTRTSTAEPPKNPDFLAQASNQGGGESDKAERPREPQFSDVPKPTEGMAPEPMTAQAPLPSPEYQERLLTTTGPTDRRTPRPEDRDRPPLPLPTGEELMQQSMEMARLAAELDREREAYARRPKIKHISASTQEAEYAMYMNAWVKKVERVGNLNYPEEARRRGMSGRLVMTVIVRRDGTVGDILLNTPSGHKVLDDAAQRTVRLAEPFPPLPHTGEDIDELYITRTWDFLPGGVSTR